MNLRQVLARSSLVSELGYDGGGGDGGEEELKATPGDNHGAYLLGFELPSCALFCSVLCVMAPPRPTTMRRGLLPLE